MRTKPQEESQRRRERYKENPIWRTDLSKKVSVLIEEIRNQLVQERGKIYDIKQVYPAWGERLEPVEGLLTCGLISLYSIMEEIAEFERKTEENENDG
jgi:hypothetical protein